MAVGGDGVQPGSLQVRIKLPSSAFQRRTGQPAQEVRDNDDRQDAQDGHSDQGESTFPGRLSLCLALQASLPSCLYRGYLASSEGASQLSSLIWSAARHNEHKHPGQKGPFIGRPESLCYCGATMIIFLFGNFLEDA